jgi:hypothetical protein
LAFIKRRPDHQNGDAIDTFLLTAVSVGGRFTTSSPAIADERGAILSPTRPTFSRGFGDFLRSGLLHGAHVEIEQTLALVALFLILLSKLDDLFEDLHVKPFAFRLREHFFLLVVQLLKFGVQIFDPFDERARGRPKNNSSFKGLR